MINPEELRTATEKALSGLTADESLKQKILLKASETAPRNHSILTHPVFRLCTVAAVLLLMVVSLNSIRPLTHSTTGEMTVFAAGGKDTTYDTLFDQINIDDVTCISFGNEKSVMNEQCTSLIHTLQSKARKSDEDVLETNDQIIISMKDGTDLVFSVQEPYLFRGNDVWICPEFFSALPR